MKKTIRSFLFIAMIGSFLFSLPACGPKPSGEAQNEPDEKEELEAMPDEIFLTIGTHKISVKLETNSAVTALIGLLEEGDITYSAHDYGGFEKVGALGHTLPHSDEQMTAQAGDVILYSGDQIVLFYGSNSWSYTKLGKMQNIPGEELKELLSEANPITVKISLR